MIINKRNVNPPYSEYQFSKTHYSELIEKEKTLKLAISLKYAPAIEKQLNLFNNAISIEETNIKHEYLVDLIYIEVLQSLDLYEYNNYFGMAVNIGLDESELYKNYSHLRYADEEERKDEELFYHEVDFLLRNTFNTYLNSVPWSEQSDNRVKYSYLDKFKEIRLFCKENKINLEINPVYYSTISSPHYIPSPYSGLQGINSSSGVPAHLHSNVGSISSGSGILKSQAINSSSLAPKSKKK